MNAWQAMTAALLIPTVGGCDDCGRPVHHIRASHGAVLCRRCRRAQVIQ